MLRVALRPKFIGLLLLTLLLAAIFAWLGQWQLERAFVNAVVVDHRTEQVEPLADLQQPQQQTTDAAAGHRVSVTGAWAVGDPQLVAGRELDGAEGFWVVAPFGVRTTETSAAAGDPNDSATGAVLSVAVGWASTESDARAAAAAWAGSAEGADNVAPGTDAPADGTPAAVELVGRYYPGEAPEPPVDGALGAMAPAALVNGWPGVAEQRYSGYLIADDVPQTGGVDTLLTAIPSEAPPVDSSPSLLNLLYAVEWTVFGAGALYIWYRLVRDDYEKDQDAAAEAASAP